MSSEVCPFCGKTFKRLKSHLPHCKAAPCATAGQQDDAANRTTELPRTKTRKTTKKSAVTTVGQSESDKRISQTSSSLLSAPPDTDAHTSVQQRTHKPDEHVKTTSSILKPKKKSVRGLLEASKSKPATESSPHTEVQTQPSQDSFKSAQKKKASKKVLLGSPKANWVDSKTEEEKQKPPKRCNFWEDVDLQPSGGAQQGTISLQSVKATLGRPSARRPSNGSMVLSQADWSDLHFEPTMEEPVTAAEQPLSALNQRSLNLRKDESPPTATPPPHAAGERHVTGTFTKSPPLSQLSSPLRFPVALQVPPVSVELVATHSQTQGALAHRSLGMVKLRELPDWLAGKTPSHPREVVDAVRRGWQWYYRRYIDVRKGGVAGVGMLLAGYCALSYVWSYPHTKLDRWRKYH